MKVPKVGTLFLYKYRESWIYIGIMISDGTYDDISPSDDSNDITFENNFVDDFIEENTRPYEFIQEVSSIEEGIEIAKELYPEYFI